jgi:hypothetical protein
MKNAHSLGLNPQTIVLAVMLLGTGCTITRNYADARIIDHPNFPFMAVDDLTFPWMELETSRTYQFEARNLPAPLYPRELEVRTSRADLQKGSPPWRPSASLTVRFRNLAGETFFTETLDLSIQENRFVGRDKRLVVYEVVPRLDLQRLPRMTNYNIQVEVRPSSEKAFGKARLLTRGAIML